MALSTKIGIVYGAVSGTVRRIIIPDTDAELNPSVHIWKGEQILVALRADLIAQSGQPDVAACTAAVSAARGVPSLPALNNLTNAQGTVVATILADPAIDAAPDGLTLVRASAVTNGV